MGFSPGEFKTRNDEEFHWEVKDGPRIVLWDALETRKILDLSYEEAKKASDQLQTLVWMCEEGDE